MTEIVLRTVLSPVFSAWRLAYQHAEVKGRPLIKAREWEKQILFCKLSFIILTC